MQAKKTEQNEVEKKSKKGWIENSQYGRQRKSNISIIGDPEEENKTENNVGIFNRRTFLQNKTKTYAGWKSLLSSRKSLWTFIKTNCGNINGLET